MKSILLLSWFIGSVQPETAVLHIHMCSRVLGVTKLLLHQFPQSQCSVQQVLCDTNFMKYYISSSIIYRIKWQTHIIN